MGPALKLVKILRTLPYCENDYRRSVLEGPKPQARPGFNYLACTEQDRQHGTATREQHRRDVLADDRALNSRPLRAQVSSQ